LISCSAIAPGGVFRSTLRPVSTMDRPPMAGAGPQAAVMATNDALNTGKLMTAISQTTAQTPIVSKWDDAVAAKMSEPELLLYRSNLLGSDLRVTNFGGGNTSAKVMMRDHLTGEDVLVLWVKGSGGDLGSIKLDGFSTLYMDKLNALKKRYRGLEHEDEMVDYLPHCTFNLNPRAASIDTPLHAYIPKAHVDHMHPDAIIAIAACADSRRWAGCPGSAPATTWA
jgi:hypothetical protein